MKKSKNKYGTVKGVKGVAPKSKTVADKLRDAGGSTSSNG